MSFKYQNREENGPSEAQVRVGRKKKEQKGGLIELTAELHSPQHLNAHTSLRAHLRAEMMSLQLGQQGFLLVYHPTPPSPASRRPEELRTAPLPQGTASGAAILPPLVCAGTHMGPRLKSFPDRGDIIKLCRQGSGWDLDHFPQTERNTSPFFFPLFLHETKFSEYLSH